jgi:hypothetical protein
MKEGYCLFGIKRHGWTLSLSPNPWSLALPLTDLLNYSFTLLNVICDANHAPILMPVGHIIRGRCHGKDQEQKWHTDSTCGACAGYAAAVSEVLSSQALQSDLCELGGIVHHVHHTTCDSNADPKVKHS